LKANQNITWPKACENKMGEHRRRCWAVGARRAVHRQPARAARRVVLPSAPRTVGRRYSRGASRMRARVTACRRAQMNTPERVIGVKGWQEGPDEHA